MFTRHPIDMPMRAWRPHDEKGTHIMSTLGGNQQVSIINEAGRYSLTIRSRKPEAKLFKRWITHEALPTIRKTGTVCR